MKISGVDIRPGNIIEYEGGIWRAVKIQHTQPGKGGAYMQVEMKNLIDGRKNNVRFRSAETVERVRLDTKDFQYLFRDGDQLTFMDKESYEQITLDAGILGDARAFLQDGMDVVLELYDEKPISVELPSTIEATIVEADAVVKGQTASSSYKPAILDNGVRVMVPPHIGAGTRIGRRRVRADVRPPRGLIDDPSPIGRGWPSVARSGEGRAFIRPSPSHRLSAAGPSLSRRERGTEIIPCPPIPASLPSSSAPPARPAPRCVATSTRFSTSRSAARACRLRVDRRQACRATLFEELRKRVPTGAS